MQSASATQVACIVLGELLSRGESGDQDGSGDSGINVNIPCDDELLNADGLQQQINEGIHEVNHIAKMMIHAAAHELLS